MPSPFQVSWLKTRAQGILRQIAGAARVIAAYQRIVRVRGTRLRDRRPSRSAVDVWALLPLCAVTLPFSAPGEKLYIIFYIND